MYKNAFTLIELLFALSILGLLITIAIPSYKPFIKQNHANATIIQLYRAIQLARSTAIKHHCTVSLCPTYDHQQCMNNNNWNIGYMIFIDKKANGLILNKKQIVRTFSPITKDSQLFFKGFPNRIILQLTPLGFTNYQNGTFYYCPKDHDVHFARALFIIQSGRMRFSMDQNHDGVHEDSQGIPLQCP